jgi:uncharacterized protein YndB with AHSA1/START domain
MSGDFAVTVRRVLDAGIEEVYDAWTRPEILAEWLTYGGTLIKAEVRVGGEFHIDMGGVGSGKSPAHTGRYLVLERPHCIEFTWNSDWTGGESKVRIELTTRGEQTELVLQHSGLPDQKNADEHGEGWDDFVLRALAVIQQRRPRN